MSTIGDDDCAFDFEDRVPCTDDLCTGIVGPDGRCGTCGRSADANADTATQNRDEPPIQATDRYSDGENNENEHIDRVPCADEMCTGILGSDGRCGTCGRTMS